MIPREGSREYVRGCRGSTITLNYTLINLGKYNATVKGIIFNLSGGIEEGTTIYTIVVFPYNLSLTSPCCGRVQLNYTGFIKKNLRLARPGLYTVAHPTVIYEYRGRLYKLVEEGAVRIEVVECNH